MRISEALATQRPFFSFEFFPPKDEAAHAHLLETIEALRPLRPAFVSVTWGAGGSTRARTLEICKQIRNEIGLNPMAHVTCVGSTRADLRAVLTDLEAAGIENVLGLRGDPPREAAAFEPVAGASDITAEAADVVRRLLA